MATLVEDEHLAVAVAARGSDIEKQAPVAGNRTIVDASKPDGDGDGKGSKSTLQVTVTPSRSMLLKEDFNTGEMRRNLFIMLHLSAQHVTRPRQVSKQ